MLRLASLLVFVLSLAQAQPLGRPPAFRNVGLDQRLDAQVPLDLAFTDEAGKPVRLADLLHGRPVVLSLVYYQCPMLCNMVLNGETHAMRNTALELGRDYDAITVSFDPTEAPALAASKKATYMERFPSQSGAAAGWRFLTGDESQIHALASAVGFRYAWDDVTKQWAHASGIIFLTPEGRVSRYIYGIEYPKQDFRLALVESSRRKIASTSDQILLFCFHYDPSKGRYGLAILNTLKVAGTFTALVLGLFVVTMLPRDHHEGSA